MVNNWIDIIQDYLLPPTCLLCSKPGLPLRDLCSACFKSLDKNSYCCYRCGEMFEKQVSTQGLCGQCLKHPPSFTTTHAPFVYQGAIRHLILALKFNARYKNARLLGTLLAEHLKNSAEMPEWIIPVPLHPVRYRHRGFNQSIEIAKTVAKELHIPLDLNSCIRHRNTPQQIDLPAKQRRKNMKNAFSVQKIIPAQHVAIIDDVMTTGTTVNELASVLKTAGVVHIDIWVCARA